MANIKRANTSGLTKTGSAVPDVVDAPTIGTATVATGQAYTGSASVSVPFTAAVTGGAASSYTVTSSSGNTASGASSPISISDTVGTARTYTVKGVNSSGTWIASASSNSVTPLSVPQAPTMGTPSVATGQSYTGSANVSVPFTANATGGAAITSYTVTSSSGNNNSGSSSPITVSDTVGTARTYTVTATNSQGTSSASSASASTTPSSVPQAPTIGTFTDGGTGTSGSLSFTVNNTGGSAITNIKYSTDGSTYTASGSTTSPITISGLSVGTYTFSVKATNANGDSAASSGVSGTVIFPSNFESIATATGTGSSNTITFSSIPSTYKSLQLRILGKDTATTGGAATVSVTFNGDSGANYAFHYTWGDGGAVTTSGFASNTSARLVSVIPPSSASGSSSTGVGIVDFIDYASTSKYKTFRSFSGGDFNGALGGAIYIGSGLWASTSAMSSMSLTLSTGNWTTSTTIALYGVN